MTALLLQFWPYIAGAVMGLLGLWRVYAMGKASQKAKQDAANLRAAQDRVQMGREASAVEHNATSMTDDQARKEAEPWVRR